LDPRWLWGSVAVGAAIIGLGVLADVLGLPNMIADVSVNVGTAVGFAGVIVGFQHRLEQRTEEVVREEVADVRKEVTQVRADVAAAMQVGEPLQSRPALLEEYRRLVAERPAAPFVPEERVIAEHGDLLHNMEARQAAFKERFLAARGHDSSNPFATAFLADELDDALPAAGLASPALRYAVDPLDPAEPLHDWWHGGGFALTWSAWGSAVREQRLPYLDVEVRTRLEMAGLYAGTADAATGLRVFHNTSRAVVELLAIALDARRALDPPQSDFVRGWARRGFDRQTPADELRERLRATDPQGMPPIVIRICNELVSAVDMSEPDSRMICPAPGGDPQPWRDIQARASTRSELLPDRVSTQLRHKPRAGCHRSDPCSPPARGRAPRPVQPRSRKSRGGTADMGSGGQLGMNGQRQHRVAPPRAPRWYPPGALFVT
jgi:hypothetical protein